MMVEQRRELEQHQRLLFTSFMQQSLKILQLPLFALQQRIEVELQENPLLEEDGEEEEVIEEDEPTGIEEEIEIDWNSYLEGVAGYEERRPPFEGESSNNYEEIISKHICLHEYLLGQLYALSLNRKEIALGEAIIEAINDDGYFTDSLTSIAQSFGVEIEEAERVLSYIQDLEPVGVGARNLSEALLIQIKYLGWDEDPLIVELVKYHLKDLQLKNFSKIAKALGIEVERVNELVHRLYDLEPKPGRLYSDVNPVYINPDVIIRRVEENFVVELNEVGIPRLKISPYYKNLLLQDIEEETQAFIREKMQKAYWFLRSIEQRRRTLRQVVEAIFTKQRAFLLFGPLNIVPLKMQEIAALCEISESTVSRATSNKYVQTPWGIFPLKFFFTTSLKTAGGWRVSSQQIKERIKNLVACETSEAPLTDQEILSHLNDEGFMAARRTIAKYREELGIPPSYLRKSHKKI